MMQLSRKEKIISFILLICLFLIVETIVTSYFISYGLSKAGISITVLNIKILISACLFPIIGVLTVIISAWDYLLNKVTHFKNKSKKSNLKFLEQTSIIITIFTLFLFVPSIIISNWFLGLISRLYDIMPGLRFLFNTLAQFIISLLNIDSFLIFVLIQNIAGFVVAFFVFLLARPQFKKG
ncbi:MAG: hypothetical protein QW589_00565 [Candidatus Bathyarchaeia archaeon]